MACPTCDATMQGLGILEAGGRAWWCPRCGTFKVGPDAGGGWNQTDAPKLVGFLRDFDRMISDSPEGRALRTLANQSGITEAIFKPADRRS